MGFAIGIDLGTTNTSAVAVHNGKVEIIKNEQGNSISPSYVMFNDLEQIVGDVAQQNASDNPRNTIFNSKRFIGRKFGDPMVKAELKNVPFFVRNINSNLNFRITDGNGKGEYYAPEENSGNILSYIKKCAEQCLGGDVTHVVITVPANFNHAQRSATYRAARIAGLEVLRLLNEPTAAALAYAYENPGCLKPNTYNLVIDLGGGTLDVSLLFMGDNKMTVKASNGISHLGGENFDRNLVKYCKMDYKDVHGTRIEGKRALYKLYLACVRAKKELSTAKNALVKMDAMRNKNGYAINITRELLNN